MGSPAGRLPPESLADHQVLSSGVSKPLGELFDAMADKTDPVTAESPLGHRCLPAQRCDVAPPPPEDHRTDPGQPDVAPAARARRTGRVLADIDDRVLTAISGRASMAGW